MPATSFGTRVDMSFPTWPPRYRVSIPTYQYPLLPRRSPSETNFLQRHCTVRVLHRDHPSCSRSQRSSLPSRSLSSKPQPGPVRARSVRRAPPPPPLPSSTPRSSDAQAGHSPFSAFVNGTVPNTRAVDVWSHIGNFCNVTWQGFDLYVRPAPHLIPPHPAPSLSFSLAGCCG